MKKLILLGIVLLIGFSVYALGYGDINNDGIINEPDYILVKNYIMNESILTIDQLKTADINKSGVINAIDYVIIRKKILNNDTIPEFIEGTKPAEAIPTITPTLAPTITITVTPTPTPIPTTPSAPTTIVISPTPSPTTPRTLTPEEQMCENAKSKGSIDYASFASLKKDNDDYYAIDAAHECANKYNLPVSVTKGTYHIYKKNSDSIDVQTDTDFNDSTIYIHDDFSGIGDYIQYPVFNISPPENYECKSGTASGFSNNLASLVPSSGNYYIYIEEQNGEKVFSRLEKTDGENKRDPYRVYNGVVQDPIFWDYSDADIKYRTCQIPSKELVFKNAKIKTVAKYECSGCDKGKRGINIERSNTKIYNIKHSFVTSNDKAMGSIKHKYTGFFRVSKSANVTLDSCGVYSLTCDISNTCSTYDLTLADSVNVTLNKVKMNSESQLSSAKDWGVMNSAHCKNITITNSSLNRIDAHEGIYNLTVKDTIVGSRGLTITGTGEKNNNELLLEGVTWKYTKNLINLRGDYGATWNGSIRIVNCKVENANSSVINLIDIGSYSSNVKETMAHPVYGPTRIAISGLKGSGRLNIISIKKAEYKKYYLSNYKEYNKDYPEFKKNNVSGFSQVNDFSG